MASPIQTAIQGKMLLILLAILGLLIAAASAWNRATQPRNPTKQEIHQSKKADAVSDRAGDQLKKAPF